MQPLSVGIMVLGLLSATSGPVSARSKSSPETSPSVPVVYVDAAADRALAPPELGAVLRAAEAAAGQGRELWFILVRRNDHGDHGWVFNGTVFFRPDETSPRLRKGYCAALWNVRSRVHSNAARAYVQVSAEAHPFGKNVEVPEPSLLPFDPPCTESRRPALLKDADVIAIVDCARAALRQNGFDPQPVSRVETGKDGVRVETGWGFGFSVLVRKVDGKYQPEGDVSLWSSQRSGVPPSLRQQIRSQCRVAPATELAEHQNYHCGADQEGCKK